MSRQVRKYEVRTADGMRRRYDFRGFMLRTGVSKGLERDVRVKSGVHISACFSVMHARCTRGMDLPSISRCSPTSAQDGFASKVRSTITVVGRTVRHSEPEVVVSDNVFGAVRFCVVFRYCGKFAPQRPPAMFAVSSATRKLMCAPIEAGEEKRETRKREREARTEARGKLQDAGGRIKSMEENERAK